MSLQSEIDKLRDHHHLLDGKIEAESTQIVPDAFKISTLKKQKLKIKDRIQQLETSSS